jgi:hypothetical protein
VRAVVPESGLETAVPVPSMDSRILERNPLAKLLNASRLDGNFPFTIAVSAISALTSDPLLVSRRPRVGLWSTAEFEPPYHHAPVLGSLKHASISRGAAV